MSQTQEVQEDRPFVLPHVFKLDGESVEVPPPRSASSPVRAMLLDLLNGDFNAAKVLLDWLKEHAGTDFERQIQFDEFLRLLRGLTHKTIRHAVLAESYVNINDGPRRFRLMMASSWESFRHELRELFAFDLFDRDDAMRFVCDVMLPGKLDGYEEGA